MFIKICGITNKADAFAAVEAGADALGFVLWPQSKRYVAVEAAARIVEMLPASIARVAVLVNPSREEVEQLLASGAFNTLQFHGDETSEFCAAWCGQAKVWKAFRVAGSGDIPVADSAIKNAATFLSPLPVIPPMAGYSVVDAVLLDSYSPASRGGTGKTFDWSLAREAKRFGRPVILSGGLTPANVREAVRVAQPDGVDVSSGVEMAPGRKDHEKVREFIRNAKAAITT
ncbi:MAG: phosphoribosylanthranilate isomerase [Verrucomicrobia bacterium]|nr:phosphoribosylanthranilate isomerase [Verrucomicrobiota bacterium]